MARHQPNSDAPQRVSAAVAGAADLLRGLSADRIDPDTPESLLASRERTELVAIAVGGLSPQHQRLIELRYGRDLSQSETAAALQVSVAAVSRMEFRAIGRLRASLALAGIGPAELAA